MWRIIPHLLNLYLSEGRLKRSRAKQERRRKKAGQPHLLTVYLTLNDPYSYLLLQVLQDFQQRFDVEFDFRTVLNRQSDMYPAPQLWDGNAHQDGRYLADLYGLDYPQQLPNLSSQQLNQLTAQLLHWELQPGFLEHALALFKAVWQGDVAAAKALCIPAVMDHVECYQHHLMANEALLKDNGHYLSAMVHYGGEWYWGVDRLQYLEARLIELGVAQQANEQVRFNKGQQSFCRQLNRDDIKQAQSLGLHQSHKIHVYWSLRSPYSYIGLVRITQLAKHYGLTLNIKPVLPMVMRRMQVPENKKSYIPLDTKREALKHGIAFGKICDPLGAGVERCYALYDYAVSHKKGEDFLLSVAQGVWSQGLNAAKDPDLKIMLERVGLDWSQGQTLLQDQSWREWAQDNLAALYEQDLWGVPSFVYGDKKVFGQDRIDCIEKAIVAKFSAKVTPPNQQIG